MPKQPKTTKRKPGRPKLAEHEAKAKIVPVRFAIEDLERIQEAANRAEQTVSEWIRNALAAAVEP